MGYANVVPITGKREFPRLLPYGTLSRAVFLENREDFGGPIRLTLHHYRIMDTVTDSQFFYHSSYRPWQVHLGRPPLGADQDDR